MFSRFFIDRPIFATVLSVLITLAGIIAVVNMPLAQFPSISPPIVSVDCTYPGASAQVVSESVATPIEQQVNGVEGMLYMASQCTNDGTYNLTVTFKNGVDLNMAQVLVQNRVNLALPSLPDVVKQTGVTTRKRSPDILLVIQLISPKGRYSQTYLSNYAVMRVRDEVARIPGVSDCFVFGQRDYSMRIWVDPEKVAYRGLSAGDVLRAIREHNIPVAAGNLGQSPTSDDVDFQYPLDVTGRIHDAEAFKEIIIKTTPDGRAVRLKDVAKVALGPKAQNISNRLNGLPCVGIAIFQFPDANALDVADAVMAKMHELKADFPEDLDFYVGYDTTPFTRESIWEVVKTLQEAILLVAIVVLLFLQNWRSAIIPLVAVPVAIIGTFVVMAALGFSLNNLTLFGLVLAIGIVVDDAIVVVEAVEHHIEEGLAPRDATIKAMDQVFGPVIAVGLVLSAVFVPCAFIGGITGLFFRQFAVTIAVSTVISAFNSLTLSPALAALLLKPRNKQNGNVLPGIFYPLLAGYLGYVFLTPWMVSCAGDAGLTEGSDPRLVEVLASSLAVLLGLVLGWFLSKPLNYVLGGLFRGFNYGFRKTTQAYTHVVGMLLRVSVLVLVLYFGLLGLTWWSYQEMPRGFVPNQDMGYLLLSIQLPDSASSERTLNTVKKIEQICLSTPGIKTTSGVSGQSFILNATGSNFGSMFVILDGFENRRGNPELSSDKIMAKLRLRFTDEVYDGIVGVFGPPPIRGVGRAGGFKVMVEDRGADISPQEMQKMVDNLVDKGNKTPGLLGLNTIYRANVPQLYIDIDRKECLSRGVALKDVFDTLQINLGSFYVNDFNLFGRTWQVILQAEYPYRDQLEDIRRLRVPVTQEVPGEKKTEGPGKKETKEERKMVPLGSLATVQEKNGPLILTRYNMYPAAAINGGTSEGVSSGQGISLMEALAAEQLPSAMAVEWTEMAYLEQLSGNTAMLIFALAVIMVFLVLAAQYESWSLPLAIILVVPMCILSALAGVEIAQHDINIFTQIGFVVLVGLASKNAILIVEFAKKSREAGMSRREATLQACQLRLRPIIMTSMAFILGVVPLILSNGAGAEMRRILGTAVFSGMLGVTIFGIFLTPVFFYVIDSVSQAHIWSWPVFRKVHAFSIRGLSWVRDVSTLGPVRRLVKKGAKKKEVPVGALDDGQGSPNGDGLVNGMDNGNGSDNGSGGAGGNGHVTVRDDGKASSQEIKP